MQLKLIERIIDNQIKIFDKNLNYLKNISLLITDWSEFRLSITALSKKYNFCRYTEKKRRNMKLKEKNYELIENK